MTAKLFEVGDVLPATSQLKISWTFSFEDGDDPGDIWITVYVNNDTFKLCEVELDLGGSIEINGEKVYSWISSQRSWVSPYTSSSGNHNYMIIDTSSWSESKRTVSDIDISYSGNDNNIPFYWEDLNPQPSGYTITFDSNGGTTISDIEDATELPTPLPPITKPGYTFGGWYYDSNFQTRAKAGDTIEANITLYAKWLTLAQVLEHLNNVVEELRSAIIDKGGDAEGKLLIDFATIINSLKTYEVVETLAELELLEPTLNRIVYVVEGSGELAMGEPIKITQDGDTLIIG